MQPFADAENSAVRGSLIPKENFPVSPNQFPVPSKFFPVRLFREFS